MRKFGLSVLALISAFALAGCTKTENKENNNPPAADQYDTVLSDSQHDWVIHGQNQFSDGTDNGWNAKAKELYEKSKLTAISINQAAAINADLGATLKTKNVEYLYKFENYYLGYKEAGWVANYKANNKLYKIDGSMVFKCATVTYDAEDEIYSEDVWIPDPHKAHVEALTNNLFVPQWTEAADADGFSWSSNQVVTSGAGAYTIVVAKYKATSTADVAGYGYALYKTKDAESTWFNPQATELVKFVAADHTYGVIGDFAPSNWNADVAMTANAANTEWTADITTTKANAEIKVRVDGAWDISWGGAALDDDAKKVATAAEGGNIVITEAGSYTVTLKNVSQDPTPSATISIAKKAA